MALSTGKSLGSVCLGTWIRQYTRRRIYLATPLYVYLTPHTLSQPGTLVSSAHHRTLLMYTVHHLLSITMLKELTLEA